MPLPKILKRVRRNGEADLTRNANQRGDCSTNHQAAGVQQRTVEQDC